MSVFSDDPGILRIREDKARRNHAEAMNFLENDFKSIAQVVQRYWPPAVLAKAAWWAATTNAKDELAKARARFMPVLLQSVVQSRYFQVPDLGYSANQEIRDKDWERLHSLCDDASRRFLRLIESHALIAVHEGRISSEAFSAYREKLFLQVFGYDVGRDGWDAAQSLFASMFEEEGGLIPQVFGCPVDSLTTQLGALGRTFAFAVNDIDERLRYVYEEIRG